jgi:hypothetical protein
MSGMLHVRICGGSGEQSLLLPGKSPFLVYSISPSLGCGPLVCSMYTFQCFYERFGCI